MAAPTAPADNFDEVIKELEPAGLTIIHKIQSAIAAIVASAIPAYVFLSKFFSVDISYYPLFIGVTVVCTILLYLTYNKMAAKEFPRVMERKKRFGEMNDEKAGQTEAHAYAVFAANLLFLGSAGLMTFVVMPRINLNIPTYVMYALVTILSGVFAFGCGCGYF